MKQIAIDGPAGAGKSTIAKEISKRLNFMYVDTGAMYRTLGLWCIENSIDPGCEKDVAEACSIAEVSVKYIDKIQHMFLNAEDVSDRIRTEQVSAVASAISKFAGVRDTLVKMQQEIALEYDVVMDGRDIGTVVLPKADLKIYMTASVDVRAKRRYDEYLEKGETADPDEIKKDISQRDHNDMNRALSPLKKAEDAIELDTSDLGIEEVVGKVLEIWNGSNLS